MAEKARRVLLKLSGEAMSAAGSFGIDGKVVRQLAAELRVPVQAGIEVGLVIGGGNYLRGKSVADASIGRATADYMGMLATVMNGLALHSALTAEGVDARVLSAIEVRNVVESFVLGRCLRHLAKKRVVILVGGTGNPYFSTDTCASLRAVEIGASVLLKGTKVSGVYSEDPNKDAKAKRYERITFAEVLRQGLQVMDTTAIAMCMEHRLPIRVFDMMERGNVRRALEGGELGTLIASE
ncbi:MAG: UMP kinase [Planctomycetes bacterium]|nr:UMP kinase [Planctomycetota bacterium]